ncbi:polyribonucleotide nucleotidyltransferase [Blattabacterium cuenoti]|uniref:polyribonucleotide nucleotidyltransferase n=1 Tax=Blattabacterium cuenoti TaxID=1653831 RepID=UPI00163D1506|nr:polyribonucleotide nucleotidyltransferase [Blattabacterium cuenoti]
MLGSYTPSDTIIKETISLKDGSSIIIETGNLAKQANGSATVRINDTILLATVVLSKETKNENNFLPLTVDYREKYYASGKIPGGFVKREGRPTNEEILIMRLVDRVLRPMFPCYFKREIQISILLLSYDYTVSPDGLAGLAASSALSVSGVPFYGPISEVRIVRSKGKFFVNPNIYRLDYKDVDIDLVIGASIDSILMIEGEMKEIKEKELLQTIIEAHNIIIPQIEAQKRLASKFKNIYDYTLDLEKKNYLKILKENENLKKCLLNFSCEKIKEIYNSFLDKKNRSIQEEIILNDFKKSFLTEEEIINKEIIINQFYEDIKKEIIINFVLKKGIRLDGRKPKQIRSIYSIVNYLPSVHGSALFSRGETQSLTTVTLGSSLDINKIENVTMENQEKFYLHYNFPQFSTGEIGSNRGGGLSRREIGHGYLAQRALKNIIPDDNPYTIRIVSEILESNGSSSMATVCAASLALMDAGIPIKRPVSGISMGLFINVKTGKKIIVSDLSGEEDYFGNLDFKIAGTDRGITACQMDVKNPKGFTYDVLNKILIQALEGRILILKKMLKTLPNYRKELKSNVPKIYTFNIPKDFIGLVIGPGGKVIQEIQSFTKTSILIEERDDFGHIEIIGADNKQIKKAIDKIKQIIFIPELGKVYKAKVKSIKDFGAFVEIHKGVEGLLHISEIVWRRLNNIEEELKVDDVIDVKLIDIDKKSKKMKFSRKILIPNPNSKKNKKIQL